MAREINAELLDTKIEKAQQDLVKAKHRYDAAAATLKDLLDNRYCDCHFIYGGIWNSKIFSKTWIDYVESFSSDIYVSTDFACDSILYGHGKAWLGKHKNRTYYCVSII